MSGTFETKPTAVAENFCFSAKGITKVFGGTKALKGVELEVRPGEIVGLVGENGAGKSTLLKIIIGAQPQTEGTMTLHGKPYAPKTPMDANKAGIGMVFQEQSLIVNLNVAQNIFFGHEKEFKVGPVINWAKMNAAAKEVLAAVDITDISPTKKVSELNFATRQMIEIAKVMNVTKQSGEEHCLILLDEPTSVLNEEEIQNLYVQMRKIADQGHSVIFVSHHLDEILNFTDRIYVYKDGQSVGTLPTKEATEAKLYELMVGKGTSTEYYHLDRQTKPQEEVLLEVKDLCKHAVFKNIYFQLHRGEVLGLAGVVGSGVEELCEVICGDEKPTHGEIMVRNREMHFSNPQQALKESILMIPKERLFEGIVSGMSVEENIAMSNTHMLAKHGIVSAKAVTKQAQGWIDRLRIKTSGPKELLLQLSGGNQQKVVFSRALASEAEIVILNHPTRGVDVGAKEEIYNLIRDMTDAGKGVIVLGDTVDEYLGLCSRLIVMKDGLITGEFDCPADNKPEQASIVSLMM